MERNRNKVEVNEDMIKDIMAGDSRPNQSQTGLRVTRLNQTQRQRQNRYPVKKHLHVLKNVRMRVTTTAHCIYHRGM